jgi:hypothetical protein
MAVVTPATAFRKQIDAAKAGGASPEDMRLRLTLGDVSKLKRDPAVALADISFKDGVMRFLGVRVDQGGVTTSALDLTGGDDPPEEAKAEEPKKKTRAKAKVKA